MPMLRRLAGTNVPADASNTARPSMAMRPRLGSSNPATERSVVVLPQPDGPSSVYNSPSPTSKPTVRMPPPAPRSPTR